MGSAIALTGKAFPPGIHVPSLTWFRDEGKQEIDWAVQEKHFEFLISSGLHGIVTAGTNGEAAALRPDEKAQLITRAREVADRVGRPHITITAGCGGQCTRDVIADTQLAKSAGADFALVLVPSYFHFSMDQDAITTFFEELADASPIPIIIYNFPAVVAGLDLNSEMLSVLGKHPNIAGVKLTCGGIAKVARIRAEFEPEKFSAVAGQSDWLLPGMTVGATGAVTGVANLYPKSCMQIYDLYQQGKLKEAREAQIKLAEAEWGFGKGGINGTKFVVAKFRGYPLESSHPRRPFPKYSDPKKQAWISEVVGALASTETSLLK